MTEIRLNRKKIVILIFIIVDTLTGKNIYGLKVSNAVSILYNEDETIPKKIEKIIIVLIVGINSIKIYKNSQVKPIGRRKENIIFPIPPSLRLRSMKSLEI